jgi:U3 small nucleolar RNA-associated protein 10
VTLTQIGGQQYVSFVEDILKPGVYDLVERINNDDMWKKINYDILMHTRNAQPQVRLAAFKIVEHLFNRIGERYLILLNDTIPFLSEGMEDENTEVEICAKAIVARIEQMTGDSIHEYLK